MKKYVIVGTSARAYQMFAKPIQEQFSDIAQIVGLFDINRTRCDYFRKNAAPNAIIFDSFEEMLDKTKPDAVIVTTVDCVHHQYIIAALQAGYDVISEKPMTIDAEKARAILKAERESGKKVHVTFNCRFMPFVKRVKMLLNENVIGEIHHVNYEYLLDRKHGADYYRRWHRRLENSGGLLVHKATHHFDMVNWWLNQFPISVYANATLSFYGKEELQHAERCCECADKKQCAYAYENQKDTHMQGMYFVPEKEDGYYRDRCVFSPEINIYDTMSVNVQYDKGTLMTYSLVSYSPYEGWKISFTGSKGRIEAETFYSGENAKMAYDVIRLYNEQEEVITYKIPKTDGEHSGGDIRLLNMLIRGDDADNLNQLADSIAGVNSLMVGVCANKSILEHKAFSVQELFNK